MNGKMGNCKESLVTPCRLVPATFPYDGLVHKKKKERERDREIRDFAM
jgi:hypothetical protein